MAFIDAVNGVKRHVENERREFNLNDPCSLEHAHSTTGTRVDRSRSTGRVQYYSSEFHDKIISEKWPDGYIKSIASCKLIVPSILG